MRRVTAIVALALTLVACGEAPRPDTPAPPDDPKLSVETIESNTRHRGGWRIVEVADEYRCVMFKSWEFGGGLWCERLER